MRWYSRRWASLMFALTPLVGACYVYKPVAAPEPQPGMRLALDLNDQGRAALVTIVGPEVDRVEGALVSNSGGEYVIRVSDVFALHGTRTKWSGEAVGFRQEHVKRIRERKLSRGRTAFAVAGVLGATVGLVAGTGLAGLGSGSDDRTGGGGPGEPQ